MNFEDVSIEVISVAVYSLMILPDKSNYMDNDLQAYLLSLLI